VTALVKALSEWALPALLFFIPLYGLARGVRIYECFVAGAEEGLRVGITILPYLVGMFVVVGALRASGAMDGLAGLLAPVAGALDIPVEVVPLMLIRPLSGGGALGVTADLLSRFGPDSFIGRLASAMQGSTDTTLYVLTLYFGSVGIRRTRHALLAGLVGDLAGFVGALYICTRWAP